MNLNEVINEKWLDAKSVSDIYQSASPFPHIVMDDFIKLDVLEKVLKEFPDLAMHDESAIKFNNANEIKFAGRGMGILSPAALYLTSYLNSDLF